MAEWVSELKAGDVLVPNPLWNKTERWSNRLAPATKVLEVKRAVCQTGTMVKVHSLGGQEKWLDAGWFTGKQQVQPASSMTLF